MGLPETVSKIDFEWRKIRDDILKLCLIDMSLQVPQSVEKSGGSKKVGEELHKKRLYW